MRGVVQVGLDYRLTKSLSLNADLKYLQVCRRFEPTWEPTSLT